MKPLNEHELAHLTAGYDSAGSGMSDWSLEMLLNYLRSEAEKELLRNLAQSVAG